MKILLCLQLLLLPSASAFDYGFSTPEQYEGDYASITLTDAETKIQGIVTLFTNQAALVTVNNVEWSPNESNSTQDTDVNWETLVNGKLEDFGNYSLVGVGRDLPDSFQTGSVTVSERGTYTITVRLTIDESEIVTESTYQAYPAGVSIIPLLVVLILAATTHMVELSLFTAIFIGACIVAGSLNQGFKDLLDIYILEAVADVDHGYVYLFTLFLSGVVGMMEKSGGMMGFTKSVAKYARTAKSGEWACFFVGVFIFFDDYANVLLAGETMRPLLDLLFVSREKLAFIVDATAAPIASISPISSWVGYEVGLIQTEIDRIIELNDGDEDIGIKTTGLGVFMQSIKYRYYPIFMLVMMMFLLWSQRDWSTMLIAERKTEVYQRTDGGDGKGLASTSGISSKQNQPREDTPKKWWNMVFPVLLLVFFIFWLLIQTGTIEGVDQTFMEKIEASNSFQALLWGTMATALCVLIFYLLQIVDEGHLVIPGLNVLKQLFSFRKEKDEDAPQGPRFLMTVKETTESFLFGMGRIFPALIVLTLAWASGAMMIAVGADRLFSAWIVGSVNPQGLPTLSFLISFFIALATGTSWGTMAILFPLILVPTYIVSEGDEIIFYAVVAGVLSGSVAGDHVSPISDTTVLSSLACDCKLMAHVGTQAPYVILCVIVSMCLGTIPIGYQVWPNIVGYIIGWVLLLAWVYIICVPVLCPSGRFDIFTELFLKCKRHRGKDSPLFELKEDTIRLLAERAAEEETTKEAKSFVDNDAENSENDSPTSKEEKAVFDDDAVDIEEDSGAVEQPDDKTEEVRAYL